MPRRYRPAKRPVRPDQKFNNENISRFVNRMMRDGKKSKAYRIMYDALDLVSERITNQDPVVVFETALRNVTPAVEVKPRRVGGSTYQVPVEVPADRALSLAIRWILASTKARNGRSMAEKLAAELMDAFNNEGNAIRRKDETHRMAEANRAFANYRW
ncbi:MAG: 30S ribosomal protein S7 [Chloroflexi bacterium]|nr:30S ribosomal protein S7 [Chloroflexota bacterium]